MALIPEILEKTKKMILTTSTTDENALEVYPGVYLVSGDYAETKIADPTTVCALRTDLPEGHPLYNARALPVVPSGSPDILVDSNGIIEPEE